MIKTDRTHPRFVISTEGDAHARLLKTVASPTNTSDILVRETLQATSKYCKLADFMQLDLSGIALRAERVIELFGQSNVDAKHVRLIGLNILVPYQTQAETDLEFTLQQLQSFLPHLRYLVLQQELSPVDGSDDVTFVVISCDSSLAKCSSLTHLTLGSNVLLNSFHNLKKCQNLTHLMIFNGSNIKNWYGLDHLIYLQVLNFQEGNQLEDFKEFPQLVHLESLAIQAGEFSSLPDMKCLPKLRDITLNNLFLKPECFMIASKTLQKVCINACKGPKAPELVTLQFHCPALSILHMNNCSRITPQLCN